MEKLFGCNKLKDLKQLLVQDFKTEDERLKFFNKFRKTFKYIIVLNTKELYDIQDYSIDVYEWSSTYKIYQFCLSVPSFIKKVDWSKLCIS